MKKLLESASILFVEDDESLQNSITYILKNEGFDVIPVKTGEEAVHTATIAPPDLLLLDLVLPGMDGFSVCETLKRNPRTANIYVVMLTGKKLVTEIAAGLRDYADDYITKPFEPEILLARIHAILRRKKKIKDPVADSLIKFQEITIDPDAREVVVAGQSIKLTKTEFDLLLMLAKKPNIVFTRTQILEKLRFDDYEITERIVDYQISGLRKKLYPAGDCIETIRGVGYKFKSL